MEKVNEQNCNMQDYPKKKETLSLPSNHIEQQIKHFFINFNGKSGMIDSCLKQVA